MTLAVAVLLCCLGAPPESLTIKGQQWKVVYPEAIILLDPDFGPIVFDGMTDCARKTILVSQEADDLKETLLHEAAHSFTCNADNDVVNDFYNSDPHGDHEGIDHIAEMELQLIRDNPALVAWIQAK